MNQIDHMLSGGFRSNHAKGRSFAPLYSNEGGGPLTTRWAKYRRKLIYVCRNATKPQVPSSLYMKGCPPVSGGMTPSPLSLCVAATSF